MTVVEARRPALTPARVGQVAAITASSVSVAGFVLVLMQLMLRLLPGPLASRLRSRGYRLLGVDVSPDAYLMGNLIFRGGNPGYLKLLHIGSRSRISSDVTVNCDDHIVIGDRVTISPYVRIYTSTHAIGPATERCHPEVVCKPVVIEDGAWIALGAMLLPGVRIGAGSVVGAGAVVTSDVPPNSLVGGVPATVIRTLP